jgi:heptosyltransferase-2
LKHIEKILVVRLSSLGDIILTTPVIRALKNQFPESEIDFLLRKNFRDVYENNPYINNLFYFEEIGDNFFEQNYDWVVDLQNNLRSKKIREKFDAEIFTYKKPSVKKFLLVNFKINKLRPVKSIPQRYAESVPNLELDESGLELFIPENILPQLENNGKYIGFCPGSRHFTKMWLPEYFVELGKLLSDAGFTIVLFGGKDDKNICAEISEQIPSSINLCNDNNLLQTAKDMTLCDAVVCNDSGLMHAAAAVQTPVAALFGSTVKEFGFAPYGVKNLILENNSLSCRPCSHIGKAKCPKGHFNCMKSLTPELVFEELKNFFL